MLTPLRKGSVVACVLFGVLLQSVDASAQASPERRPDRTEDDGVRWQEHWPRFHWAEYTATGLLLSGALAGGIFGPKNVVRWDEGNDFDDGIRGGLRLTPSLQSGAGTASDVLFGSLLAYPYLDAGIAWWVHGSPDVAWQMAMINTQSIALTAALTMGIKLAAGRTRPYTRECKEGDAECLGDNYASSYLSGHTAYGFTGAGLICAHHTNIKLYGGGAPDYLACAAALGAATATGVLRIAADRHYATDVLSGAAVGIFSGYVLPNILHYRFGATPDDGPDRVSNQAFQINVTPVGGPNYLGVGVSGIF